LIIKTFKCVVEESAPQQRMMQELLAWTSRDLQGILRHLNAVEAGSIEPFPPLLRRRPLRDIGFETSALREHPSVAIS
jgi:hypothetical protein